MRCQLDNRCQTESRLTHSKQTTEPCAVRQFFRVVPREIRGRNQDGRQQQVERGLHQSLITGHYSHFLIESPTIRNRG
jgi:hypothetical protein